MARFVDFRTRHTQQSWRCSLSNGGVPRVVASYSDMGPYITVGCTTGVVTVLDVRTGVMVASARPHDGDVSQVALLDRDTGVSASSDGTLVHWDAQRLSIRSVHRGTLAARSVAALPVCARVQADLTLLAFLVRAPPPLLGPARRATRLG